jgi:hypothetical protein
VMQRHPRGIPYLIPPMGAEVRFWSLVHFVVEGDDSTSLLKQDNAGITLVFLAMVLLVALYMYVRNGEL